MNRILAGTVFSVLGFLFASWCPAENTSIPGTVFKEIPTLHCLGVRWPITGDQNKNAVINVAYRKKGNEKWTPGYPLFRTHPNPVSSNRSPEHTVKGGWMFAGSIVDLEPDTEYEVKLNLVDPDGGNKEEILQMKTWKEPMEPEGMTVKHVVPGKGGGSGTKANPFKGLDEAVKNARPGTLFLLHKGTYVKGNCKNNTWIFNVSGKPGKPIVFRGAGDGKAILDGGGNLKTGGRLLSACSDDGEGWFTRHIWMEDLTFQGRQYAIVAHRGSHWVIRRCEFRNMTKGFTAHNGGYKQSQHHFIVDNTFTGPTKWPRSRGIEAYTSVKISGAGHVVAYNLMQNLGDGIHGCGHGFLSACDWHNNDITICTDDGLEADYGKFNMRVYRNRIFNFAHGITAQPSKGGPIYIYRNFLYNGHNSFSPFKLNNHTTGVLIFHNTCLKQKDAFKISPANETVTNVVSRNNLFLCSKGWGLYVSTSRMRTSDFDNDGYGGYTTFARWNRRHTYKTMDAAKKAGKIYTDNGAIKINLQTCFKSGLTPPKNPNTIFKGDQVDGRLGEHSDAVDTAVSLPGFNNFFTGKAPDLGCFEREQELPHWGPRPKNFSSVTEIRKFTK